MEGQTSSHKKIGLYLPSSSSVISSMIAGLASRTLLHPIDTVKARLQVQQNHATNPLSNVLRYNSTWDAIVKIQQREGFRGFYKGLGASLLFTGPAITLYLSLYDLFNNGISSVLNNNEDNISDHQGVNWRTAASHLTSGFLAETFSCVVWVPHDVLKERLQVNQSQLKLNQVVQMVRTDGFKALYRGYGVTLATFGPQSALYFLAYEYFKKLTRAEGSDNTSLSFLVSAGAASGLSAIVVCPLDVVKTRMQVQRKAQAIAGAPMNSVFYRGMFHGLSTIYKQEGVSALFKGITARTVYSIPNSAIIMTLYEYMKRFLDEK